MVSSVHSANSQREETSGQPPIVSTAARRLASDFKQLQESMWRLITEPEYDSHLLKEILWLHKPFRMKDH